MTTVRSINKDFFPCYLDIQSAKANRALKWVNNQSTSGGIIDSLYNHFLKNPELVLLFDSDKIHELAEKYAEYSDNIDKLYAFVEHYLSATEPTPSDDDFCRRWRAIVSTLFEQYTAAQSVFDKTLYGILLNDFLWNVSLDPYNPIIQNYNLKRISDIRNSKNILSESIKGFISEKINSVNIDVDDDGTILIKKNHSADLAMYFNNSCRLMKLYRDTNNINKLKTELAKIYYINELIEIKYIYNQKRTADEQKNYKTFAGLRSNVLSTFKTYLTWVLEQDKEFDFESFYEKSPYGSVLSLSQNQIRGLKKLISTLVL